MMRGFDEQVESVAYFQNDQLLLGVLGSSELEKPELATGEKKNEHYRRIINDLNNPQLTCPVRTTLAVPS